MHFLENEIRKFLGQYLVAEISRLKNSRKIGLEHNTAHRHEKLAFFSSA